MGLEINRLSKGDKGMPQAKRATARIYRTTDGLFVGEGDPRGAYLAYGVGAEIAEQDVARFDAWVSNSPQDALDSQSLAAKAYTDEEARDVLRRRQAGDITARAALNQEPALIHDRLATELADEAAALAAAPVEQVADLRNDLSTDGQVFATRRVYRTETGDLVNEGAEGAVTLAYAVGQPVSDADVDEYNDLDEPDDDAPADTPAAPKQATKSTNKAVRKPADK